MPVEIDLDNLPPFPPAHLAEKLKAIRERLKLSPDKFAPLVGVACGEQPSSLTGKSWPTNYTHRGLRKNAPKHRKNEALQQKKHNKYLDTVRRGQ